MILRQCAAAWPPARSILAFPDPIRCSAQGCFAFKRIDYGLGASSIALAQDNAPKLPALQHSAAMP
jgi:hypothetical protein